MRLYQFRFSARRRPKVFKDTKTRRRVILGLAQLLAPALVSFSLVFEHGHVEAYAEKTRVGMVRRSIRKRLYTVVRVPFEPVWCEPVEGEAHAFTLFKYNAEQVPHHGLSEHPALFDGSYFQDMVGARNVPKLRLRVMEAAPSLRLRQLYQWVGLPPVPIWPATDEEVLAVGIQRLKAAAASATAADPALHGRCAPEIRAKRAVVHLALAAGIRTADVRWALELTQAGVDRLRARPADPAAVQATRIRLSLEQVVIRETWKKNGT